MAEKINLDCFDVVRAPVTAVVVDVRDGTRYEVREVSKDAPAAPGIFRVLPVELSREEIVASGLGMGKAIGERARLSARHDALAAEVAAFVAGEVHGYGVRCAF
jgi:hypothetical protein